MAMEKKFYRADVLGYNICGFSAGLRVHLKTGVENGRAEIVDRYATFKVIIRENERHFGALDAHDAMFIFVGDEIKIEVEPRDGGEEVTNIILTRENPPRDRQMIYLEEKEEVVLL